MPAAEGPARSPPFLRLRKILADDPGAPVWPEGVAPRPFRPDTDAAPAHALLAAAYRNGGGAVPPFETWWRALHGDPEYDPALVFPCAGRRGTLVGFAQCWTSSFLKDLAVDAAWRRRGIGRALLLHVFGAFRARGAPHLDLKVETGNPSGAERLYASLGMTVVDRG